MKKAFLFLLVLAVVFTACDSDSYKVSGDFSGTNYDGKYVYLQKITDYESGDPIVLDSAKVEGGKFMIKGKADATPSIAFVTLGRMKDMKRPEPGEPSLVTIVLEKGDINIVFNKAAVTLSGTPKNEELNKIHQLMNQALALEDEVQAAGGMTGVPLNDKGQDVQARAEDVYDQLQKETYNFTKNNIGNKAGEFMFISSARSFTVDQLKEIMAIGDTSFTNIPQVKQIKDFVDQLIAKETAVIGHPYKDVSLVDANGKKVNLSAYVGKSKYVFLDFWASWCGPCIKEIPNLQDAYAKYKDKGFDIVGISLDQDKKAWTEAVKAYAMTWTQLHDESQEAAKAYEIASIPYTLLLDEQGNVVAMNLRGEQLEEKLAQLLQ